MAIMEKTISFLVSATSTGG